jgi:hypothetical protein
MPGEADAPVCAEAAWENKDVMHSRTVAVAAALPVRDPLGLQVDESADFAIVMILKSFVLEIGWLRAVSARTDTPFPKTTSTARCRARL